MTSLTTAQQRTYDTVRTFIEEHGYPPTIREAALAMGMSVNGANFSIRRLIKKGALTRDKQAARGLKLTNQNTPQPHCLPEAISTLQKAMNHLKLSNTISENNFCEHLRMLLFSKGCLP